MPLGDLDAGARRDPAGDRAGLVRDADQPAARRRRHRRAGAQVAHAGGARLVVDNTFASPYLQQPLALGADVVVHSTTKYLGGHSDVVGGALVGADAELGEGLAYHQNAMGAVPGAFDSWLVLRGAKTLGVRMDRHCANAAAGRRSCCGEHPAVAHVLYPGLPEHPGHEVAAKQMRDFGGMVSLRLAGGEQAALELCRRTRVFTLGESLGGVESLVEHPGRMTHASVAGSPLEVPVRPRAAVGRHRDRRRPARRPRPGARRAGDGLRPGAVAGLGGRGAPGASPRGASLPCAA